MFINMLRLHWPIFCAFSATQKICASVNGHFLTHFPTSGRMCRKADMPAISTRKMRQCKRATRKACGAFTHANKMCRIDAENICGKNVPV